MAEIRVANVPSVKIEHCEAPAKERKCYSMARSSSTVATSKTHPCPRPRPSRLFSPESASSTPDMCSTARITVGRRTSWSGCCARWKSIQTSSKLGLARSAMSATPAMSAIVGALRKHRLSWSERRQWLVARAPPVGRAKRKVTGGLSISIVGMT